MVKKLTLRAIDALAYDPAGARQQVLWDAAIRGLGVRVYPSGAKSYVLRFRVSRGRAGRRHLMALGPTHALTLDQARDQAQVELAKVIHGENPAEDRARERAAASFGDVVRSYLAKHQHKRSAKADAIRAKLHLLPKLGTLHAGDVTRAHLSTLHHVTHDATSAATANRVLALASTIIRWASRTGLLPEDHANPASGIPRFPETSRDRFLTRAEVRRVLVALEAEPSVYTRAYFWLLLLTGARSDELRSARWRQIDLEDRILRLPKTKAGRVFTVPLSAAACDVLRALPRDGDHACVFPGRSGEKPMVNTRKAWLRICEAAQVEDARPHDLRRTLGSWMAQSGASLHLIGSVLNHSNPSTTAVYARFRDADRREALEAHAQSVIDTVRAAPEATEP